MLHPHPSFTPSHPPQPTPGLSQLASQGLSTLRRAMELPSSAALRATPAAELRFHLLGRGNGQGEHLKMASNPTASSGLVYIYIYLCVLILFRQLVRPNHTTKDQMPPPAVSVVPPARWPKTDSAAPAVVAWTWLQSTRSLDWSTLTFFFSGFRRPVAFVLFERIILNLDQPSERYGHKTFQQC